MPAATQKLLLLYSQLRPISLWALVIIIWLPRKCPNLETSSPSTRYKEHPNKNLPLSFPQKSAKRKQTGQRQWGASLSYQVTAFSCLTNGPPICPLKMKSCGLSELQYLNTLNTFWTHCQPQTPEICQPHIGSTSQFTEFLFTSMHFFFPREKYVQCILSCMKTLDRSSTLG